MKVIGLISGGKDSFYNLMQCVARGHEVVCLGNLCPDPKDGKDELDSFMYQTVGHETIGLAAQAMGLPLYRQYIKQNATINSDLTYQETENDEVEHLYILLKRVKQEHPDIQGVSVGAILSSYQRTRVENICGRLGLVSLAFLWQRNQVSK